MRVGERERALALPLMVRESEFHARLTDGCIGRQVHVVSERQTQYGNRVKPGANLKIFPRSARGFGPSGRSWWRLRAKVGRLSGYYNRRLLRVRE